MLRKCCKSDINRRLFPLPKAKLTDKPRQGSPASGQRPLSAACSGYRPSPSETRGSSRRSAAGSAGSAPTAAAERRQPGLSLTGLLFQDTLPPAQPGLRGCWNPRPERHPPPLRRPLRPPVPTLSIFPGRTSSRLPEARLPCRACAPRLSCRPRRCPVRVRSRAERSGAMALHVPKAPGFAQMLKEGAKVRAAPGGRCSLQRVEGGRGRLGAVARGRF